MKGIESYPTSLKAVISKNQIHKDKLILGIEERLLS